VDVQRFFLYRIVARLKASVNQMAYRIQTSPVVMSHPPKIMAKIVVRYGSFSRRGILRPP
jgi:hypothetical protein